MKNKSKSETYVAVPLMAELRKALAERANSNGRSLGREVVKILEKILMRNR